MHNFADSPPGLALCKRWLTTYNEYLFLIAALRQLSRDGVPLGQLRELIRARATQVTDQADEMQALGYRADVRFAGAEAALWSETLRLASGMPWPAPPQDTPLEQMLEDFVQLRNGWTRFEQFVAGLPENFFAHLPALDPQYHRADGVLRLVGQRRKSVSNGVLPNHVV